LFVSIARFPSFRAIYLFEIEVFIMLLAAASLLPVLLCISLIWVEIPDRAIDAIEDLFFVVSTSLPASKISWKLMYLALVSVLGFIVSLIMIPIVSKFMLKAKIFGKDINKGGSENIPESLGLVTGTTYLICVILFQPFFVSMLGIYNAGMISICLMILLGFSDDVLDLRWAVKICLSFLASVPLLVAYDGSTDIIIPKPLRSMFGYSMHLGLLYHIYMLLLSIFCTNSINILAGINGLEVGQSLVIGLSVFIHSAIQLFGNANIVEESDAHLLSIVLVSPFITTCSALLYYNWYPSKVFVGDTFTYFAGMTLAVIGILGHFSKTLMLFFIPQFLNFFISLPQLFGFIPCPKHRLPRFNPDTKLLYGIPTNWNLVNLTLLIFGPMSERNLCIVLLLFQCSCTGIAFFIRYYLSTHFF